jgi:hypothetical protein
MTIASTPFIAMQGVFPWYEDQARGHPYGPDYAAMTTSAPGKPTLIHLVLNDLYRFDQAGTHRVRVVTNRTGVQHTSNEVSSSVESFPEEEESALAASLENRIRNANDMCEARGLADELDALPGDAATRAKISLFLHPKVFEPFGVDVVPGLWMARNRRMVVAAIEAALVDPQQYAGADLLELLAALKARLLVPFNPANPAAPLPTKTIQATYIHQLAQTLPARTGKSQVDAARTVLFYSVNLDQINSPDFAAAREVLVTNFGLVNKWTVDTLLNAYGKYLVDIRMLPALRQMLDSTTDPMFNGTRAAIVAQMARLQLEEVPKYLAREACSESPAPMSQVRDLTSESTLQGVDECLRAKLLAETTADAVIARRRALAETLEYIARFATALLVPDVRTAYLARKADWDQSARGAAVTYLMRWDATRSQPLLEELLPGRDLSGAMMFFLLAPAYPPTDGLRAAFRNGLTASQGRAAGTYAFALAQVGNEEDREFLRRELKRLQLRAAVSEAAGDAMSEIDMIDAIIHGRSWDSTQEEKVMLERSCVTAACKERFLTDVPKR